MGKERVVINKQMVSIGWAFPLAVDGRTGKIAHTDIADDIRQSLWILLNTLPGERLFHADYGCNLHQFIFEPVTYQLVSHVESEIRKSIARWEKRIEDVDIEVFSAEEADTALRFCISYRIKTTGELAQLLYPLNLLEMDNTGV